MYFLVWFCHAAANIGQWFKWNGVNPRNPYAVLERFPISPSSVTTSPKGANTLASISLLQLMGCTNWPVCHQTASLNYTSYHMHSLKVDFRPVDTSGQNIVFRPPIRPCLWEQCRVTLHNLPTYMYVLCLIHIIYTTSRRILTYCWETWWREGLISPEVTCWRTSPLWQSSDIACLSCLSHLLTLYTLALAFSNLCIFSCIYIYIAIKSKCRCTKIHVPYMSYVYKITLPAPFHWTNLPENLVAPITASLPPQWVQHASSPATLQKPQLVKLLTWIDVRITLIFEQLWIYWWKNECIMMNMKTLAATPPRNIYRLFLIKAPSLKKERANLLSTFQLLFVPIPVFGTWRCGQSQKTRTLLIRMSFPAGNPDRKILKGTCPPRLVGKWVSFL